MGDVALYLSVMDARPSPLSVSAGAFCAKGDSFTQIYSPAARRHPGCPLLGRQVLRGRAIFDPAGPYAAPYVRSALSCDDRHRGEDVLLTLGRFGRQRRSTRGFRGHKPHWLLVFRLHSDTMRGRPVSSQGRGPCGSAGPCLLDKPRRPYRRPLRMRLPSSAAGPPSA